MEVVTVEALKKAGFENPEKTFEEIALAGGFGAIKASHGGGLHVGGIGDDKAKAAVDKILAGKGKPKDKE